ncbi:hypothetical protein V5O48_012088 [Marasmius crinis-equi]|uniref:Sulfotransferase domain-containing protein n=1 Tax=Marasmius crinis-equi TaxID=585013 RepID=A0ABR3F411_9AGAR
MASQHRRVYVMAHTRSASHLFYQLLSKHPSFQATNPCNCSKAFYIGRDCQASVASAEMWQEGLGLKDEDAAKVDWQSTLDSLQMKVRDAELKDKWFLTMDHPYHLMASSFISSRMNVPGRDTKPIPLIVDRELDLDSKTGGSYLAADLTKYANPTLLPDRFFFSFTPIITIRHPTRAIPSYLRAYRRIGTEKSHPDLPVAASFLWERLVFDSFKSFEESRAATEGRVAKPPIVVDGEKLVKDPHGQMKKLCEALDLDEEHISYSWDRPGWATSKLDQAFAGTFSGSTGVIPDAKFDRALDTREEMQRWVEEWDEATARMLEEMVNAAIPDYEYLVQYSL